MGLTVHTIAANASQNDTFVLQEAITGYRDEAYTNAKKLSGTAIVGPNPEINTDTESYIGQVRWYKPMNPTINVASLTDSTAGTGSVYDSDYVTYIKTVRTYGADKVNMSQVVTREDGLAKIGRDFAEHNAQDEHNAILAVLRGVMIAEAIAGTGSAGGGTGLGGQSFTNDPTDKKYGFYVDIGSSSPIATQTAALQGAARAEAFLQALGKAWKDYEPEYAYLVCSPEILSSLRSANLVDQNGVVDGNITINTIFQGKLRLIQTRATQGLSSAELTMLNTGAGVDITGTKTSFIVLPGAVAMEKLVVPMPVEITRSAAAYKGGGVTNIWNRWGYVLAPAGYNWNGLTTKFPSDAEYAYVKDSIATGDGAGVDIAADTPRSLAGFYNAADVAAITTTTKGTWIRKTASALSLGILPIFHG